MSGNLFSSMPPFDINQIQTVEEAALCFEDAYS